MAEFVFWQDIISPHMAGLARALADRDEKITYIVAKPISTERQLLGWSAPALSNIRVELLEPQLSQILTLMDSLPRDSIHLTQGLRRNGPVANVHHVLRRQHKRWGAMMEKVDDRGLLGRMKRLDYVFSLGRVRARPDFILAIGAKTTDWVAARGFPRGRVFESAYFLDPMPTQIPQTRRTGPFRFCFGGQFIRRKRLDLLIQGLAGVRGSEFELVVIGAGPLEAELRRMAETRLGRENVRWLGQLSMMATRAEIAACDCLVLPSEHDGWGAVVIEAMMSGTPAICSDACGSANAVRLSLQGGVFESENLADLRDLLAFILVRGPLPAPARQQLAAWANCFSSDAGAKYVSEIAKCVYERAVRPNTPWERGEA